MVEFHELSPEAQEQVTAIVTGEGLGTKSGYAEALEFVNSDPSLRNMSTGGRPTGFTPSQFGKAPQGQFMTPANFTPAPTQSNVSQADLRKLQEQRIERINATPFTQQQSIAPTPYLQAVASSNPQFIPAREVMSMATNQQLEEVRNYQQPNRFQEGIARAEQKVTSKLFPPSAKEVIAQKNLERIENRIINFNERYGGRKLTQEEYDAKVKEERILRSQAERYLEDFDKVKKEIKSDIIGQFLTGAGVGLVSSPFQVASFGVGIVTEPIETFEETIKSIGEIPTAFREDPAYTSGYLTGNIVGQTLLLKAGGRVARKTVDFVRTRDLVEIPFEDVVAPEYLAGQRFPEIKSGQTAGELLKEFRNTDLYGVTELKGFTASPNPLPKNTQALAGSSELAGLYQAPKLSPAFLKISKAERKAFSIFGESWRPTIVKANPVDFELAPYLKFSSGVVPQERAIKFFKRPEQYNELIAEQERLGLPKGTKISRTGKSFIPFIKSEKEAVIPAGTKLAKTGRRFFIKFEGRKIPIDEFDTIPVDDLGNPLVKIPKSREVSVRNIKETLSSSRLGRRAIIEGSEIVGTISGVRSSSRPRRSSVSSSISSSLISSLTSIPSSITSGSSSASSTSSAVSSPSSFASSLSSLSSSGSSVSPPSSMTPPSTDIPSKPTPPRRSSSTPTSKREERQKSYNVYIKAPKRESYVKVTKAPVGLEEARDTRNFFIDQTTSRQGYIKETGKNPSPLGFKIPKGYASSTDFKFRQFKSRRGKKIKLEPERLIERGSYLIDSQGEKRELDIFKAMAEFEKKRKANVNKPVGLTII